VAKIEKGQSGKSTGVVISAARGVDGRLKPAAFAITAVSTGDYGKKVIISDSAELADLTLLFRVCYNIVKSEEKEYKKNRAS